MKVVVNGTLVNIEGPIGKKSININTNIFDLKINDNKEISLKPKEINDDTKRLWGMNRKKKKN